jgi:uncharacterized repeat protein (TIGR03837 family)
MVKGPLASLIPQLCLARATRRLQAHSGSAADARRDNPATVARSPERFDVFCRIVDNFGDAGVALRLSRQLAHEHAADVTLWIDDVAPLARIAPGVDALRSDQRHAAVRVRPLDSAEQPAGIVVPDVVVETFGCGLPEAYLDAMERAPRPPVWVNLEYLSAERWVDTVHALPSPHPKRALKRWFLFPGFTPDTGGLLRERDLFTQRDRHRADPLSRTAPWTSVGLPAPAATDLTVSLFCYPNEALPALLEAWSDDDAPIACIVPEGVANSALDRFLGGDVPQRGQVRTVGALTLAVAPFVDQDAFDRRLWASELNIVRGEDSFLRAQWAAKPFVWHIYPQSERAHATKLAAFLDRYTEGLDAAVRDPLRDFWNAFNEEDAQRTATAWRPLREALPVLRAHAETWADRLLVTQRDLATQLVDFARDRL